MRTTFTRSARGGYSARRLTSALGIVATATASLAWLACSDSTPPTPEKSGTFFGPTAVMADGSARAYVSLDRTGTPTEVGVAFSESALAGLPTGAAEFVLALPSEASSTAF